MSLNAEIDELKAALKIAQGNTDAAIDDYNAARDDALEEAAKVVEKGIVNLEGSRFMPAHQFEGIVKHNHILKCAATAIRAKKSKADG